MHIKTKDLIVTALFAALTAVGAFIKIPIGPIPITLQIFFIALSGILLGPYLGALSQLIYVVLGLVGLPVFTTGGGLSYIFNPTFGYLLGFIIAPIIIGKIFNGAQNPKFLRSLIGCFLGVLVIYIIGVPYMYMILICVMHTNISFLQAITVGFVVFIPGDIVKCIAASILGIRIVPAIRKIR